MRTNPIRHELAWHDEIERAAVRIETAERGRLQPAVERASSKITAKSRPDRVPSGLERCGDLPFRPLLARLRTLPLHWLAPP